jgi:type I restriction enzyme, R subunit
MAQQKQEARRRIDHLLELAGWFVCDPAKANIHAARGIANRESPLNSGHGFPDHQFYLTGKAASVLAFKYSPLFTL